MISPCGKTMAHYSAKLMILRVKLSLCLRVQLSLSLLSQRQLYGSSWWWMCKLTAHVSIPTWQISAESSPWRMIRQASSTWWMLGPENKTSLNIAPKLEARVKWETIHTSIMCIGRGLIYVTIVLPLLSLSASKPHAYQIRFVCGEQCRDIDKRTEQVFTTCYEMMSMFSSFCQISGQGSYAQQDI